MPKDAKPSRDFQEGALLPHHKGKAQPSPVASDPWPGPFVDLGQLLAREGQSCPQGPRQSPILRCPWAGRVAEAQMDKSPR